MNIVSKLLKHELISGTFYIFIGSIFGNFLAFLLNLFLARNLSYADYAIFASLLSVITLVSIPGGSMNTVIVKFATNYFAKQELDKGAIFYRKTFKYILYISIISVVGFYIFSIPIKNFLHLDSILYVVLSGLIVASFYLSMLNNAFLQSLLKFKFLSLMSIIAGVVKLIAGVVLVFMGYKAFGALWSIFFMTFVSFLVGFIPLKNLLKKYDKNIVITAKKEVLSYAFPVSITVLFLTSFTSMDVILVKHFFSPHTAGFYAGLSLIGKVIFYFTVPIPAVMFPLLVKRHATGKNFVNLFYLALVLVMLPSIAITSFYFIFPSFVINLFLGGREYLYVSKYLGIFGLYLTVFSLVNVCVNFFLSLNKTNICVPVVLAAVSQIILIYIFHSDFYQVIGVSLLVSVLLFITLLIIFFKNFGNFRQLRETITFANNPKS